MATTAATFPDSQPLVRPRATDSTAAHWSIYAVLFASTSVILGVIWDISWHRTIGRDTFWTPAHLAIQLGGIIAGSCGAYLIIAITLGRLAHLRPASVSVWGFRAPLGAFVAVWGAATMR